MNKPVLSIRPLGFPWETSDPFLFCVHHNDHYPSGNEEMAPDPALLAGRNIGNDFTVKDGWRMYHGSTVPGFPSHPHRGFETITFVMKGLIDHADSLGAAGRFGNGDVQWMTAGKGVQHSEMFPLLQQDDENHLEFFQIWLNLPRRSKMVEPHFKMFWDEQVPTASFEDEAGKYTRVTMAAGPIEGHEVPAPPPDSWAADPENEVAVWRIEMDAGAVWSLPEAGENVNRRIYFFKGDQLDVAGEKIAPYHSAQLDPTIPVTLSNGNEEGHLLLLQGKPINEPVVQYGPYVMNSEAEIRQTMMDYGRTQFGGWPWPRMDQVHDRERGKFARHADGTLEEK